MTERRANLIPAGALKEEFDRAFCAMPSDSSDALTDFLGIAVGGLRCAVQVDAIAGVHKDLKITGFPIDRPDLIGLAAVRGTVVPVYDLRFLLGQPTGERDGWLMLTPERIALSFDSLGHYFRVPSSSVSPRDDGKDAHPLLGNVLGIEDRRLSIIDVKAVVETIGERLSRNAA